MKVKLNPMFEQVSGQLGELVFREMRGKTVASRKPTVTAEPSADQTAHRERFKQAAAYGKSALADAETRAIYEEYADTKNMPVFALTVADFFSAPVIDNVDLSTYDGQVGEPITILARDEFGVMNVRVALSDQSGNPIESGDAVEVVASSGRWVYTATVSVNHDNTVNVSGDSHRSSGWHNRLLNQQGFLSLSLGSL